MGCLSRSLGRRVWMGNSICCIQVGCFSYANSIFALDPFLLLCMVSRKRYTKKHSIFGSFSSFAVLTEISGSVLAEWARIDLANRSISQLRQFSFSPFSDILLLPAKVPAWNCDHWRALGVSKSPHPLVILKIFSNFPISSTTTL